MFIACKFHELYPPVISDFIQVTKNSFTKEQLLQMETQVMMTLEFSIHCTIPMALLESYSMAIGICHDSEVLIYACYLIDLSMLSAEFLKYSISNIVICALTMSLHRYMFKVSLPVFSPKKIEDRAEPSSKVRMDALQLLCRMAEHEALSKRSFLKCQEQLKVAMKEPLKSMQKKYEDTDVLERE